ncbi:MAG: hypothetical protein ABI556_00640 [Gemmatimonadales bacterium]
MKPIPESIAAHKEFRVLSRLKKPGSIQDFLDEIPINHERRGETCSSPVIALRRGTMHCMEGALVAALALWMNGHPPLIMDLKSGDNDVDHLVTLFMIRGFWGGITKTNHAVLRYREPIFRDPRELAVSYFHEYTLPDGRKTLRSYSAPYDLRRYRRDWITTDEPLWDLETKIDKSRHYKLLDRKQIAGLRRADDIEIKAGKLTEWR